MLGKNACKLQDLVGGSVVVGVAQVGKCITEGESRIFQLLVKEQLEKQEKDMLPTRPEIG